MDNVLILFDCFGVILNKATTQFFADHFEPEQAKALAREYCPKGDLGTITFREIVHDFTSRFGFDEGETVQEIYRNASLKEDTADLLRRLKPNNHLALVSNITIGMDEHIQEVFDFNGTFEKLFCSCRMGVKKPELEIYRRALAAFPNSFGKVFMIDDTEENLTRLPEIGIIPVLFRSAKQTEEELLAHGVRIE